MQEVRVKEVKSKTGVKNDKPWELVILISDDGTEYTTFDTGAKQVGNGGLIELDPIIKGGKISFKQFNIKEKGGAVTGTVAGAATAPANGRATMAPQDWARKDAMERLSYEAQTAYKGVMELAQSGVADERFKEVFEKALKWAEAHLDATMPAAYVKVMAEAHQAKPADTKAETTTEGLWEGLESGSTPQFKNFGELLTEALRQGVTRSEVLQLLGLNDKSDLTKVNKDDAWQVICEAKGIKPSQGK